VLKSASLFTSYLRTWGDLGISHIQFNVVDRETLLAAQREPEKHQDLVVRVAGYSAYFVDLSKGLQDSIIARTEQSLGGGGISPLRSTSGHFFFRFLGLFDPSGAPTEAISTEHLGLISRPYVAGSAS